MQLLPAQDTPNTPYSCQPHTNYTPVNHNWKRASGSRSSTLTMFSQRHCTYSPATSQTRTQIQIHTHTHTHTVIKHLWNSGPFPNYINAVHIQNTGLLSSAPFVLDTTAVVASQYCALHITLAGTQTMWLLCMGPVYSPTGGGFCLFHGIFNMARLPQLPYCITA